MKLISSPTVIAIDDSGVSSQRFVPACNDAANFDTEEQRLIEWVGEMETESPEERLKEANKIVVCAQRLISSINQSNYPEAGAQSLTLIAQAGSPTEDIPSSATGLHASRIFHKAQGVCSNSNGPGFKGVSLSSKLSLLCPPSPRHKSKPSASSTGTASTILDLDASDEDLALISQKMKIYAVGSKSTWYLIRAMLDTGNLKAPLIVESAAREAGWNPGQDNSSPIALPETVEMGNHSEMKIKGRLKLTTKFVDDDDGTIHKAPVIYWVVSDDENLPAACILNLRTIAELPNLAGHLGTRLTGRTGSPRKTNGNESMEYLDPNPTLLSGQRVSCN